MFGEVKYKQTNKLISQLKREIRERRKIKLTSHLLHTFTQNSSAAPTWKQIMLEFLIG